MDLTCNTLFQIFLYLHPSRMGQLQDNPEETEYWQTSESLWGTKSNHFGWPAKYLRVGINFVTIWLVMISCFALFQSYLLDIWLTNTLVYCCPYKTIGVCSLISGEEMSSTSKLINWWKDIYYFCSIIFSACANHFFQKIINFFSMQRYG